MSAEDKNKNLNNSERAVIADSRNTGPEGPDPEVLRRDTRRDEKFDFGLEFNYDSDVADKRAKLKNASGKGVRPVTTYIAPDEEDSLLDFFGPEEDKEDLLVKLIADAMDRSDAAGETIHADRYAPADTIQIDKNAVSAPEDPGKQATTDTIQVDKLTTTDTIQVSKLVPEEEESEEKLPEQPQEEPLPAEEVPAEETAGTPSEEPPAAEVPAEEPPVEEPAPARGKVTVNTIELDMPPELLEPHKPSLDETIQFRMDADVLPSIFERAQEPATDDVLRMIEENADPYGSSREDIMGLRRTAEIDLSGVVRTRGLGIPSDAEDAAGTEEPAKGEEKETEPAVPVMQESYGLTGDPLAELTAAAEPEKPNPLEEARAEVLRVLTGVAGRIKGVFATPPMEDFYGVGTEADDIIYEAEPEETPAEDETAAEAPAEETAETAEEPAEDAAADAAAEAGSPEVNAEEVSAEEDVSDEDKVPAEAAADAEADAEAGAASGEETPEPEQTLEDMVIADSACARRMLVLSGALAAVQGKSSHKVSAGSSNKNKKTGGKTTARKKAVSEAKQSDAAKSKLQTAKASGAAGSGKASGKNGDPKNNKPKSEKPKKDKPKSEKPKNDKPKNDKPKADKPANKPADNGGQNNQLQEKDFKKVKPKKKRKRKNKFLAFFGTLFAVMILLCFVGGIAGAAYVGYTVSHAPTIQPKAIYDTLDTTTYIYDDKDKLVDEIYFSENREIVTYEQLPENLVNAFVAVEDKTFWTHSGFNFRRIIGAVIEKFHGGMISGTSTITQQLARNVFLPEEKSERSIKRKITEMYYAYEIEEELSKEDIITAYLNTIYLGYGCYGVDIAARTYFNKKVEDLSLEQCAALAALPQAPGTYALLTTEEGENTTEVKDGIYANDISRERRDTILGLMQDQGYITAEEKEAATKPLTDFIEPGKKHQAASKSAFRDYLLETVRADLMSTYELSEEQADKLIYARGLRIYSTLDSQAQKTINKQFAKDENFPTTVKAKVKPEAAMVIAEVGTGQIKAMVGGRKETGKLLFNRATNPRQPGSSIKPLTVYSSALQMSYELEKAGKKFTYVKTGYDKQGTSGWGDYITTTSSVIDEKMTVKGKTWPQNATKSYTGRNTFRTAMYRSINTCAVKILSQVGIGYSMDMLHKYGITTAIDDTSEPVNDYNLAALGLGAMSVGVTPLDMAIAYTVFPNGGVRISPTCYTRVEDSNGKVILEAKPEKTKVLNPGVAWIMTNVLEGDVKYGIAGNARIYGTPVAGKTGTTNDQYDIWFDGFTPKYAAALWIGTDKNVEMNSMSEKAAALWSTIMSRVDRAQGGEFRERPDNVIYWYGDYYTRGTQPPAPKPKAKKSDKKSDSKTTTTKPAANKP